jgi:hypothetical protein
MPLVSQRFFCILITAIFSLQLSAFASGEHKDGNVIAYMEFGENPKSYGLTAAVGDVNVPVVSYAGGKSCWELNPSSGTANRYLYIDIDDSVAYNLTDGTNVEVIVEYYDNKLTSLTLEYGKYDQPVSMYSHYISGTGTSRTANVITTELEILDFQNTGTWKKHTWLLPRAALKNTLNNNSADFRIGIHSALMGYSRGNALIRSVEVRLPGTKDAFDISVTSSKLGNIFFTNDTMEFDVKLDNSCLASETKLRGVHDLSLHYTLIDSAGRVCSQKTEKVIVEPFNPIMTKVSFDVERYDLYKLIVEAENKELGLYSQRTVACSYSFTTRGEVMNMRHGVSTPFNTYSEIYERGAHQVAELIRNAGFSMARINHPAHGMVRAYYNQFDATEVAVPNYYRRILSALIEYGVSPTAYMNLSYLSHDGVRLPDTDENIARYVDLTLNFLRDLGGTIENGYFEIDNEPNAIQPPNEDFYISRYFKMAKELYPAIKREFPNMTVGALTLIGIREDLIQDYLEMGGLEYCDVLALHPYHGVMEPISADVTKPSAFQQHNLRSIRDYLDENGYEHVPIYGTEYGYSSYVDCVFDDFQQACYDAQSYFIRVQEDLCDKLILFQFLNMRNETRSNKEYNYGMIGSLELQGADERVKGRAKPGYLMSSVLNYKMSDAQYVDRVDIEDFHTLGYRYKKSVSGKDMLVLFTNKSGDSASFDLGVPEITVTDHYGNENTIKSVDGKYTFSITQAPIYIEGNFSKFNHIKEGGVFPTKPILEASYNRECVIDFVNNTNKVFTADIEILPDSLIKVKENLGVGIDGGRIVLELGNTSPKADEPVKITLRDDTGIYYQGTVAIRCTSAASLGGTLNIKSDGDWYFTLTVENNSKTEDLNGYVRVMYPSELAEDIPEAAVSIPPGESAVIEQKLPPNATDYTNQRLLVTVNNEAGDFLGGYERTLDFVYATYAEDVTIDADLSDWNDAAWIYLDRSEQFLPVLGYLNEYKGRDDIWARMAVKWDEENLYFAAEVHDDVHYTVDIAANQMWQLDNIQLGILYDPNNVITQSSMFEEISFALMPYGPDIYRHLTSSSRWANTAEVEGYKLQIKRDGNVTCYELLLPWNSITPQENIKGVAGLEFKIAALINENDGTGRKGYYMLGDGIHSTKSSEKFLSMLLFK